MNFTAPEALILVVDDNEINLEITAEILEPLQMQIELADSGKRALEMIGNKKYHLIFMDHMMPVMDGIETTKRIRRSDDAYYHTVPIIALTGNTQPDDRKRFAEAGMNDLVAKPVEIGEVCKCLKKWLPEELIIPVDLSGQENDQNGASTSGERVQSTGQEAQDKGADTGAQSTARGTQVGETDKETQDNAATHAGMDEPLPDLPGINAADGIRYSGSEKLWYKLLGDFYKLIDAKANKLEKCLADGLIRDYTIEVHALKNTARMVGAGQLSGWFGRMENCGNAGDVETIARETPELLEELRSFKDILRPYGEAGNQGKREATPEELIEILTRMRDAMDEFDVDTVDASMRELEKLRIPDSCTQLMEKLRVAVVDVMMEEVMDIADEMTQNLQG